MENKINKNLLPVPLKYTYPLIMKIKLPRKNNPTEYNYYIYLPELGSWILKRQNNSVLKKLEKLNINYEDWVNRWILKIKKEELYTEKWAEAIIHAYYNNKPHHTKDYIKKKLLENHDYKCEFLMVKQDLIEIFSNSRKDSLVEITYYYDLVPEIIKNKGTKITLQYKDDNGVIHDYKTNYSDFIARGLNCNYFSEKLRRITFNKNIKSHISRLIPTEDYIKLSKEKFGEDRFEYLSEYTGRTERMTFKCNNCGTVFTVLALSHLNSHNGGCPTCNFDRLRKNRSFSNSEFQDRLDKIYGIGRFKLLSNFVNCKTNVLILDTEEDETFYQDPENLLYHGLTNPRTSIHKSRGEKFVELWINNNKNIIEDYKYNVKIDYIEGRYPGSFVKIDFIIVYKGNKIWIEYNGIQHYTYFSNYHKYDLDSFERQKTRDKNVREYCMKNNIKLIEIPYTMSTYKKVEDFLIKTIIEGIDPNTIVDYEYLYNNTKGK